MFGIKTKNNRFRLFILYLLGLLLAISAALPAYIQSSHLKQFVSLEKVSLFYLIANAATALLLLVFPKIIKKLSNYSTAKAVLIIYTAALLGLSYSNNAVGIFFSFILFIVASNLIWINMDILIKSFSSDKSTGKIRTTYLTFMNLGWIASPILSAYLIKVGSYALPYLLSAALILPIFLILMYQGYNLQDKIKYQKEKTTKAIKAMWKDTNLRGIFFIALLLQIFYSCAVVYIPLYLNQTLGMGWDKIGIIFSLMLIPFVLVELPAGIIADKYIGEKEILTGGFIILIIALLLFFYVNQPIFWVWAILLFGSRVGAALVEAMRDTYFFKIIDADDIGFINIFRTSGPIGYILGLSIAMIVLAFFPINYIFLVAAIVMLSSFFFIYSIKDTK